jgi:probable HAF family extracellular repeat protein
MRRLESMVLALVLIAAPNVACAQMMYNLIDLSIGAPYDGGITINGINDAGHMAGYGVNATTGEIHAFIDRGGAFQDLGLLGYSASDGIAINGSDQLAVDGIGPGSTALYYASGQSHRLGSVDGGYTSAYAINSHGDIVGSAKDGDGNTVGFSWIGGVFQDLTPVGFIRALSINDADQIVGSKGYYWVYGGYGHSSLHGCLYSGGVLTDLGSLTGDPRTDTEALGINASGQIVGYSTGADGFSHAFLYESGAMHDLGTIAGENATAIAINDHGLVIGNLTNPYGANLGAFVVENGVVIDLSTRIAQGGDKWSQLVVTGLNNTGDIVGYGTVNGETHSFLAVPAQPTAVTVARGDERTALEGSWPNPFRLTTAIPFRLSSAAATANVRLEIFDATGRRIARLLDQPMSAGEHTVSWNGRTDDGATIQSGVYFVRLGTRDGSTSTRLVLER